MDIGDMVREEIKEGIDIIGYRSTAPASLIVIQCKCVVDFNVAGLRKAVKAFCEGAFYGSASEFLILTADNLLSDSVEQEAIKVRHELLSKHCLFDIMEWGKDSRRTQAVPGNRRSLL